MMASLRACIRIVSSSTRLQMKVMLAKRYKGTESTHFNPTKELSQAIVPMASEAKDRERDESEDEETEEKDGDEPGTCHWGGPG